MSCALKDFGCFEPILHIDMSAHYMTEQHQSAILTCIRRLTFNMASDKQQGDSNMGMNTKVDILPLSTTLMILVDNNNASDRLAEIYEMINILAGGIETLNGETQRHSTELLYKQSAMDNLTKDFATLKQSVEEENIFLDGYKPNQEILHQDIESLKQKVNDLQYVSYDGTFVWKITDIKEKMSKISITFIFTSVKYSTLIYKYPLIIVFTAFFRY